PLWTASESWDRGGLLAAMAKKYRPRPRARPPAPTSKPRRRRRRQLPTRRNDRRPTSPDPRRSGAGQAAAGDLPGGSPALLRRHMLDRDFNRSPGDEGDVLQR